MKPSANRFTYLFNSTRGLALVVIGAVALVTAIWGTLSGPLAELGIKDVTVRLLGMQLVEAEREGRIISLYHSIAIAIVALLTYFITAVVAMKPAQKTIINATITVGYLCVMIFGLLFGYFGHIWIFHGLFLFGQSLVFFAGILLAVALWPFGKEYRNTDPALAHTRGGIDLERLALFTMAVATLGSALFGAVSGSYFGNSFEAFLAENVIREPHKTLLQKSIIGHLHIMLTLIAIALTLVIGRWLDFKGPLHKIAMPLMIAGTIVISLGAWSVTVVAWAHTIIYVGSVLVMLAALMLVIYGWRRLIRQGLDRRGIRKGNFFQAVAALVEDPLPFGALWQMVFMNFTVSGIGIFMAVKLDEIIRVWPWRDERITLTGHWHILSGIIATIILFYYADLSGLKGKARKLFGWAVIVFSDLAFASITVFELKRMFISEAEQQPLVDTVMILADLGLAAVLVALAIFLIWRLADFFAKRGDWTEQAGFDIPRYAGTIGLLLVVCAFGLVSCASAADAAGAIPVGQAGVNPESWSRIPAGSFLQGQFDHVTSLGYDYEMMVTDVTNAQVARFLNAALKDGKVTLSGDRVTSYYPGDVFRGYKHEEEIAAGDYLLFALNETGVRLDFYGATFSVKAGYEDHPATMVTWFGARAYCQYYGWRLPSELEWEKAARGTGNRPFPWGEQIEHGNANYYASRDPYERVAGKSGDTTPVGYYNGSVQDGYATLDSPSPYGLYDMAGNVWQWTGDVYPDQHYRYLRGGSKAEYGFNLRLWTRNNAHPEYYSPNAGFRCARDGSK